MQYGSLEHKDELLREQILSGPPMTFADLCAWAAIVLGTEEWRDRFVSRNLKVLKDKGLVVYAPTDQTYRQTEVQRVAPRTPSRLPRRVNADARMQLVA